jgi:hypothetical protein
MRRPGEVATLPAGTKMIGSAKRDAGLPGERFTFEVAPGKDRAASQIRWTGGGDPATGVGRRFSTVFRSGGTHRVTASRGKDEIRFEVIVCPIDQWQARARPFYGASVDFSRVRIGASRLVLGRSGTAWTCNDVIRFKRARRPGELPSESTLIHELGHVWEPPDGSGTAPQRCHRTGRQKVRPGPVRLRRSGGPASSLLTDLVHEGRSGADPDRAVEVEKQVPDGSEGGAVLHTRIRRGPRTTRGRGRDRDGPGCPTGLLRLPRCRDRTGREPRDRARRMDGRQGRAGPARPP